MLRIAALLILLSFGAAVPAGAVINGTSSSLGAFTLRLGGNGYCTGVAIGRRLVATAAHCARGMRVLTGSGAIGVTGISNNAVLDDGRRVSVKGDAAILKLAAPLPNSVSPVTVGDGGGDTFTIAGYGTTDERTRTASATLHEATLVAAEPRALIDPNRTGSISASACFGDSGGPVIRGGMLVGIITRAAHPSPRIACGRLTRWVPITASGAAVASTETTATEDEQPAPNRTGKRVPQSEPSQAGLFSSWFAPKAEPRRVMRQKSAER